MTFDETLAQMLELLRRDGRVSYRALKRRFDLDEEYLEDLKAEIIQTKKLAINEDRAVLEGHATSCCCASVRCRCHSLAMASQCSRNAASSPVKTSRARTSVRCIPV